MLNVRLCMIGQLLIAGPIIAIVLRKGAIYHRGLVQWVQSGQYEADCLISASVYQRSRKYIVHQ